VIVITVIAPLPSVDAWVVVITVGEGVVVITIVVGANEGDWEGCGVVDCDKEEGIVLIGVDVLGQLAKRVEVGSTIVMMLVTIRGIVTVETLPVHASMSKISDKTKERPKGKCKKRRLLSTYHLVGSAQ
jgi:hypothetical protein